MYPVFVLSKGRWKTATTPGLLKKADISFSFVVEPQEVEHYARSFPGARFFVLDVSEQGLWYARQTVLEQMRGAGISWFWMLDDDIEHFYYKQNRVYVPASAHILEDMEEVTKAKENLAQLTLARKNRPMQHAYFSWNVECSGCICVHADRLGNYRANVQEDTDMTLQVLTAGYKTIRCNQYALSTPDHGENTGGQYEVYHSGKMEEWSKNLSEMWGKDLVQVHHYKNEVGVMVDWRRFHRGR